MRGLVLGLFLRTSCMLMVVVVVAVVSCSVASAWICDIYRMADQCPSKDPAYATIRKDFAIRADGVLVTEVECEDPVSEMSLDRYSDALSVLQDLRMIYHISEKVPWTNGSLYAWLKEKIQGINIISSGIDSCCNSGFGDGRTYFNRRAADALNKE